MATASCARAQSHASSSPRTASARKVNLTGLFIRMLLGGILGNLMVPVEVPIHKYLPYPLNPKPQTQTATQAKPQKVAGAQRLDLPMPSWMPMPSYKVTIVSSGIIWFVFVHIKPKRILNMLFFNFCSYKIQENAFGSKRGV